MEHLGDLAVFARVADLGSFTAAAESLRLSKSAVSKHMARLEQRLGTKLIQRTTRRLVVTESGRAVLVHAARLLAEAEAAEAAAQNLQSAPRGLLRVNMPMSFGLAHVAPLLPEFLAAYPEMRLDIGFNDRRVDLLEEEVDVAIRIGDLPDSSLVARRLAPGRIVVCASPDYLARCGVPKEPDQLKWHHCLIYTYLPDPDTWRFGGPAICNVRVQGPIRANNGDALRQAALAGLGIVRSPSFIVGPDIAAGRLVPILEDYAEPDSGIHAVYPATRHPTPKLRAFIEFLVEKFGPEPPWDCNWIHMRTAPKNPGLRTTPPVLTKRRRTGTRT